MNNTFDPTAFPLPPNGSCDLAPPPDEAALIETWRSYIGSMPDTQLDLELVRLLEMIHNPQ
jgi:hypothetical protein